MPETTVLDLFEHQPRERGVPCQARCGRRKADVVNDHGICNTCLDKGVTVLCSQYCRDVDRSARARLDRSARARLVVAS